MSENILSIVIFTAWVTLSELRPKASQIKKVLTPDLFKTCLLYTSLVSRGISSQLFTVFFQQDTCIVSAETK